ncbi:hypothetical protein GF325_17565 [Candidatus Bathyarchaeota archaeon]|nr:hypothetical protein [Candidatus Bathyarchaeota archaeon]
MKANRNNFNIKELAVPVIYKSRDKVVNESAEDNFLFQKGEERIARYLEIIRIIHDGSLGFSDHELECLFKKYYETTTEITKANFFKIQQAILSEIKDKAN